MCLIAIPFKDQFALEEIFLRCRESSLVAQRNAVFNFAPGGNSVAGPLG